KGDCQCRGQNLGESAFLHPPADTGWMCRVTYDDSFRNYKGGRSAAFAVSSELLPPVFQQESWSLHYDAAQQPIQYGFLRSSPYLHALRPYKPDGSFRSLRG